MAGLVGVLSNGGGLVTGESYIAVVFFKPLLHRFPCFPDVHFAALAKNSADYTILVSSVDGVLWSHEVLPKCGVRLEDSANACFVVPGSSEEASILLGH